jgi:hypothetical protein
MRNVIAMLALACVGSWAAGHLLSQRGGPTEVDDKEASTVRGGGCFVHEVTFCNGGGWNCQVTSCFKHNTMSEVGEQDGTQLNCTSDNSVSAACGNVHQGLPCQHG